MTVSRKIGIVFLAAQILAGSTPAGSPTAWAMAKKPGPEAALAEPPKAPPANAAPLALPESFALALKRSEALAIKNVEIEKTWADFLRATGTAIGDVDYTLTDFFQQPLDSDSGGSSGVSSTYTQEERRERKFVISQPLFQGFKSMAALTAVGSIKRQRSRDRDRAEQVLFLDVVRAYVAVLRSEHDLQITSEIRDLLRNRAKELKDWEAIGRSRLSEIANAETLLQSAEASLARTRGEHAIQRHILEFLTGISLEGRTLADIHSEVTAPDPLQSFVGYARSRPDVQAARESVKTSLQTILIAQSELWPKISLDSNVYDRREGFQGGIHWDALLTMKVPLSRGGTTLGNMKETYSNWKQSKLSYSQTYRLAVLDIQRSYESWVSSYEQYKSLEQAVKSADQNYVLQKDDYAHNLVSNLEVLQALESLNNTRLNFNHAYYDLQVEYWNLQVACGSCCHSPTDIK
ncbi:MAG: TolC family protein [Candidatus Omnitrophota bacterium]|jgi:outer membrane protein TolC